MKKIIGIGIMTAALLAGCGGAPSGTAQPTADIDTGTAVVTTPATDIDAIPTSETGASEDAGTAADATAQPTSATGATDSDAMDTTTQPTSATEGSTSGETGMTGAYQPAGIPELGLSFQVPEGWEQVSGENAWSPAGMDVPRIGVESAEVTPDWTASSFLPEGATVRSTQSVMLPSGQAMLYTIENTDGTAESHAIIRSDTMAYDFYARAQSLQELRTIEPVLTDIVGSAQLGGV
ncbi:MAG: hypothetical protein DIU80_001705 [Chloroflexota bacterium]